MSKAKPKKLPERISRSFNTLTLAMARATHPDKPDADLIFLGLWLVAQRGEWVEPTGLPTAQERQKKGSAKGAEKTKRLTKGKPRNRKESQ